MMEEKVLSLGKFSPVTMRGHGALPPFWFTENTCFGTSCNDKKPDNDAKRNDTVIFNLTYLTKVIYISSMLKFSNTESLVVQVLNTRLNSQSLHV